MIVTSVIALTLYVIKIGGAYFFLYAWIFQFVTSLVCSFMLGERVLFDINFEVFSKNNRFDRIRHLNFVTNSHTRLSLSHIGHL